MLLLAITVTKTQSPNAVAFGSLFLWTGWIRSLSRLFCSSFGLQNSSLHRPPLATVLGSVSLRLRASPWLGSNPVWPYKNTIAERCRVRLIVFVDGMDSVTLAALLFVLRTPKQLAPSTPTRHGPRLRFTSPAGFAVARFESCLALQKHNRRTLSRSAHCFCGRDGFGHSRGSFVRPSDSKTARSIDPHSPRSSAPFHFACGLRRGSVRILSGPTKTQSPNAVAFGSLFLWTGWIRSLSRLFCSSFGLQNSSLHRPPLATVLGSVSLRLRASPWLGSNPVWPYKNTIAERCRVRLIVFVDQTGFEPAASSVQMRRSTN
jgi:hypothetical protein